MKRYLIILCIFFASTLVNSAMAFYNCLDKEGNLIITDNPPPGAKCGSEGEKDDTTTSTSSEKDSAACIQIAEKLDSLEKKPSLTSSQIKQQTGLIEELSSCDTTDNVLKRINKRLKVFEKKTFLTNAENEQKTRLLSIKTTLSTSNAAMSGEQSQQNTNTPVKNEKDFVESDQERRNAELSGQKAEMKRLLKIPRLGY